MHTRKSVYVYDFSKNEVPGQSVKERGYWRDVGTLDAYFQANMDLVDVDPIFSLYNERWPIYTLHANAPPAKFVFNNAVEKRVGYATDSLISEGCIVSGSHIHHSIVSPKVRFNSYSTIEDCIIFEKVSIGRHCKIRRAIIDKQVAIPAAHGDRLRPGGRPEALPRHRERHRGHPQGDAGRAERVGRAPQPPPALRPRRRLGLRAGPPRPGAAGAAARG